MRFTFSTFIFSLLMSPGGLLSPGKWKSQSTLGQRGWEELVPHILTLRKQCQSVEDTGPAMYLTLSALPTHPLSPLARKVAVVSLKII